MKWAFEYVKYFHLLCQNFKTQVMRPRYIIGLLLPLSPVSGRIWVTPHLPLIFYTFHFVKKFHLQEIRS